MHPLQNPPPYQPSPTDESAPRTSQPTTTTSSNSQHPTPARPSLRNSNSEPDQSNLAIPFEQLSLQDQEQYRMHQHDHRIAFHQTHAPRDPSTGMEQDSRQYVDESVVHSMMAEADTSGKGKGVERAVPHVQAPILRLRSPPSSAPQRPDLPHRTSSFSKRHASFDSPREVPLPFMPHSHHLSYSSSGNPTHTRTPSGMVNDVPDPAHGIYGAAFELAPGVGASTDHAGSSSSSTDSLPSASSSSSHSAGSTSSHADTPMDTTSSTAGVAAGMNPYFMETNPPSTFNLANGSTSSFLQTQHPLQQRNGGRAPSSPVHPFSRPYSTPDAFSSRHLSPRIHSPRPVRAAVISSRSSTMSLPLPMNTPYHTLPSMSGGSGQEDREHHSVGQGPGPSRPMLPQQSSSSTSSGSQSGSVSTPLSSMSTGSMHRGPSFFSHSPDWDDERSVSPPLARFLERAYSGYSAFSGLGSRASPDPTQSMPPPAPPVVLTPPPPPLSDDNSERAPHEPFLANTPAPNDSFIAVETTPREYRLLVRLPGFRRDAITLSTRKRRILHVVADSWEPNGGHFERRISFGYDADLAQVRAEFDGELLRIIVPRRGSPMSIWCVRD